MPETIELIEKFPELIESHCQSAKAAPGACAKNIEQILNASPRAYTEEDIKRFLEARREALGPMVEDYFTSAISAEFPLISDELFLLKRNLVLSKTSKDGWKVVNDSTDIPGQDSTGSSKKSRSGRHVTIPLFAYTRLFEGDHVAELGKFTQISGRSYYDTYRSTTNILAKLPGSVGPNLMDAYRNALGEYYSVIGRMYSHPAVGALVRDFDIAKPEVGAIWIPLKESLYFKTTKMPVQPRIKTDPAMVLKIRGKTYLTHTWNVDDEQPFEHFLREYCSGSMQGKLKR